MKFPWANTLLLLFILAELVSGFLGLVYGGSPDRAIFMQAHRVAGYGILGVLAWKARNILFSLRWRRAAAPRGASLLLLSLLAVTLALGLAWSLVGRFSLYPFSGLSWHIYVGAALVPLLLWHARYHTRGFLVAYWAERRSFLRLLGLAAFGLASWKLGEMALRLGSFSAASRRFTGSYPAGSFSGNAFPVTSWLNDRPSPVDVEKWRLHLRGADGRTLTLAYADLSPTAEVTATLDCTGGWYSTQVWRGVPVGELLALLGRPAGARSVTFTSVTGYYRRFSLEDARGLLLATHVGEEALSHSHGFPARLVAPGRRGFQWVKWVERIEVSGIPAWWQPPLPLQ